MSENDLDMQQDYIKTDMDLQKKWFLKLKPYKALLKFRLPWNKEECEYLDGKLYLQCWAGRHSTETRLVPNGKMKIYDNNRLLKIYMFPKNMCGRNHILFSNKDVSNKHMFGNICFSKKNICSPQQIIELNFQEIFFHTDVSRRINL